MSKKDFINSMCKDAVDESWIEIPGIYGIGITTNDVHLTILRNRNSTIPFNAIDYIPDCVPEDAKDTYLLGYIRNECFTMNEIEKINEYLKKTYPDTIISKPHQSMIPKSGKMMSIGDMPIGSQQGFVDFSKNGNYSLGDLKIIGHYDLRNNMV